MSILKKSSIASDDQKPWQVPTHSLNIIWIISFIGDKDFDNHMGFIIMDVLLIIIINNYIDKCIVNGYN